MIAAAPVGFASRITSDDVMLAFRAAGCSAVRMGHDGRVRGRTPAGIELAAERPGRTGDWSVTGHADDGQRLIHASVSKLRDLGDLLRAVDRHVVDRGLT